MDPELKGSETKISWVTAFKNGVTLHFYKLALIVDGISAGRSKGKQEKARSIMSKQEQARASKRKQTQRKSKTRAKHEQASAR